LGPLPRGLEAREGLVVRRMSSDASISTSNQVRAQAAAPTSSIVHQSQRRTSVSSPVVSARSLPEGSTPSSGGMGVSGSVIDRDRDPRRRR